MEANYTPDDWKAFQSALLDRFTDQMERRKDFQRMRDLEYKAVIQTYLAELEEISTRVGMTGEVLRE